MHRLKNNQEKQHNQKNRKKRNQNKYAIMKAI